MISKHTYSHIGAVAAVIVAAGIAFASFAPVTIKAQVPLFPAISPTEKMSMQRDPVKAPGNVTESKLVHEVPPKYPDLVREMQTASLTLSVSIDEEGKVIKVEAFGGYTICNDAAQRAARHWRYTPTLVGNVDPVRVIATVKLSCGNPRGRLSPAVAQLIYRIRKERPPDATEKKFVTDGSAMLEVTFTGSVQQGIDRIKRAGFIILKEAGNSVVIGSMPKERINKLRSVPNILLVAPHWRRWAIDSSPKPKPVNPLPWILLR